MKEFLKFVVVQLVDRPEEIILRDDTHGGTQQFVLELPQSEVGKVIGKQGATIRAIRNLMSNAAARQGGRVTLEILEK
jgi:predicted RNA-binding protein YlqC (UPF0109 family)